MSSNRVSQILKILFQTGDINIFVLRGVFLSRYVQLKSSFSERGKVLKENSIGRSWSSAKLLILQNYTENAIGNVPLKLENVLF